MIDRRELDRIAKAARLRSAKRPETGSSAARGVVVMRDCPCANCRYNLKGMQFDGVCPECATPVNRSIIPEDPSATPWVDAARWRPQWWINTFGPPAPPKDPPKPSSTPAKPAPKPTLCAVCGYDCKGLPRGRPCPECGTLRTLSTSPGALAAQEAVHGFARHGWSGAALALGWAASGCGLLLIWVAHLGDGLVGGLAWSVLALIGYATGAVGGASACWASARLMLLHPTDAVRNESYLVTRLLAVAACGLWCLVHVSGLNSTYDAVRTVPTAFVVLGHLDSTPLLHLGYAALLLAFYSRVMALVAWSVGQSDWAFRNGVLGFPLFALLVLGCVALGRVAGWNASDLIVFSVATLVVLSFPALFVPANVKVGIAIWWAPHNQEQGLTREQRKLAAWEERARLDREREKRFGNSSHH